MDEENDNILNNQSSDFDNFYITNPPFVQSPTSEDFPSILGRKGVGSSMSTIKKRSCSSIGEYNEVVREGFQLLTKSIDGIA